MRKYSGGPQKHRLKPSELKKRDAKIVSLFLEGVTSLALTNRFGLSHSRIGGILTAALGKNPRRRYKAKKLGGAW